MFIYTFGFHRMLQETLNQSENKETLLVKYWKVFTILLQYCSKEEYSTMLSLVEKVTLLMNPLGIQLKDR